MRRAEECRAAHQSRNWDAFPVAKLLSDLGHEVIVAHNAQRTSDRGEPKEGRPPGCSDPGALRLAETQPSNGQAAGHSASRWSLHKLR
jgi:hypothetical protein